MNTPFISSLIAGVIPSRQILSRYARRSHVGLLYFIDTARNPDIDVIGRVAPKAKHSPHNA